MGTVGGAPGAREHPVGSARNLTSALPHLGPQCPSGSLCLAGNSPSPAPAA